MIGDDMTEPQRPRCSVDDRETSGRIIKGMCYMHYERQRIHGTVNHVPYASNSGPNNYLWKGDDACVRVKHRRVEHARGKASTHPCTKCGTTDTSRKLEWARIHGQDGNDPWADYVTLCKRCHVRYDTALLNEAQVIEIRAQAMLGAARLAEIYNVSKRAITHVSNRTRWADVDEIGAAA